MCCWQQQLLLLEVFLLLRNLCETLRDHRQAQSQSACLLYLLCLVTSAVSLCLSLSATWYKKCKITRTTRRTGTYRGMRGVTSHHWKPSVCNSPSGCLSQWGICLPDADCQKVRRGTLSRTIYTHSHTHTLTGRHSSSWKKLNFLIARFQINPNSASEREKRKEKTPRVQAKHNFPQGRVSSLFEFLIPFLASSHPSFLCLVAPFPPSAGYHH